tara:strand:- start:407 stop:787 length:381 start_codon:yes stop_codon:yes gene_type:complete
MSVFQYKTGLGNSSAYQVSAIPFILRQSIPTSVTQITFPKVTKFIKIVNSHGSRTLNVGFSSLGISASSNYFTVAANSESAIYYWRVSSIFVLGVDGSVPIEIHAGLTTVSDLELTNNWSGSVGVG